MAAVHRGPESRIERVHTYPRLARIAVHRRRRPVVPKLALRRLALPARTHHSVMIPGTRRMPNRPTATFPHNHRPTLKPHTAPGTRPGILGCHCLHTFSSLMLWLRASTYTHPCTCQATIYMDYMRRGAFRLAFQCVTPKTLFHACSISLRRVAKPPHIPPKQPLAP